MEFALVPRGQFVMGDETEGGRSVVTLDKPYWMGRTEVTNEQFAEFDNTHDSRLESRHGYQFGREGYPLNKPAQPVVRVSWERAVAFCEWLTEQTGERVALPTEAQWEYACRAGSDAAFSFGGAEQDFSSWANLGDRRLVEYAADTAHQGYEGVRLIPNPGPYDDWVPKDARFDDGHFLSAPVGALKPNTWGLHDMHGNVWEWTRSLARPYPYVAGDGRNHLGVAGRRIARGGSWYDRPKRGTSAFRLSFQPYHGVFNVGFRVVLEDRAVQQVRRNL
jgi:formylglycine-generating enzyme required for sulfatase activity